MRLGLRFVASLETPKLKGRVFELARRSVRVFSDGHSAIPVMCESANWGL